MNADKKIKSSATIRSDIEKDLQSWTVLGPIHVPGAMDRWITLKPDAASVTPADAVEICGARHVPQRMAMRGHVLNLSEPLGGTAGSPQAFVFARFKTFEEGAVAVCLDVDYYAMVWVDGREVLDLRSGNRGGRHSFLIAVTPGAHTLAMRVISGTGGWGFRLDVTGWQKGIPDLVRADRNAEWRNYTKTVVRHENRPDPLGPCGGMPIADFEQLAANLGVDARWISVTGEKRGLLYSSQFLPCGPKAVPEHEDALREWVKCLHQRRISAMTWMALSINQSAWDAHPDWRQQYLLNQPAATSLGHGACCINSPYGDALIGASVEMLQKFDFDGIWFDGSFFSPSWSKPPPISCVCPHCAKKFKAAAGFGLPAAYDWSSPVFRRWAQWRYDMFSAYWQRLVDAVHKAVPQATIVFNHYHRENNGWHSGIPLAPFGHGFVSGTEADGEPMKGAFYTRLMRAYGRPDTEVWMGLGCAAKQTLRGPQPRPRILMDFALACTTAGGHSSTGGGRGFVEALVLGNLARELHPRAPYLNLPSWPYAALHVSQQTDTFVFGRNPDYVRLDKTSWYWNSLVGWHHMLMHAGLNCDVIFDAQLDAGRGAEHALREYPVLIMPMAVALSVKQYRQVIRYARGGGTVITGPWFGVCEPDGEPRSRPHGDRSLFPFGQVFPDWETLRHRPELTLRFRASAKSRTLSGVLARPLTSLSDAERASNLTLFEASKHVHETRLGRGRIVQLAIDPGMVFRQAPGVGLAAAAGNWMRRLACPPVTVEDASELILGVFHRQREVVAHVQQVIPPGNPEAGDKDEPPVRWHTALTWHGAKPKAVHCCLPEAGPPLPMRRAAGGWQVVLPPFRSGQVVRIVSH